MSSLRFARAALRVRPTAIRVPAGRRTYADAVADKIKLSLAMPHQVRSLHFQFVELEFAFAGMIQLLISSFLMITEPFQVHRRVRSDPPQIQQYILYPALTDYNSLI